MSGLAKEPDGFRPSELLAQLRQQGLELRAEGGQLHIQGPKGAMTAELRALIGAHKPELLALLTRAAPATPLELPLSEGQRALWFLSQLAPDSSGYNVSLALQLRGPLGVTALQAAVARLGELHPLLRARFGAREGVPVMHIDPQPPLQLAVLAIEEGGPAELLAQVQALSERPFFLSTEGVSRLTLFVRSPGEAVLLLSIHHIVVDYWSLASLVKDLWALYDAERCGAPAPVVGASYGDFVHWQQQLLQGPDGARQRDFWHQQLAGELPILDLPTDYPRPAVRSERGDVIRTHLDEELGQKLRRFAAAEKTTLFAAFVSGLLALLHRYTGQDEILLGTPYHGRSKPSFERVVGHFINSLTLRARFTPGVTFRQLVRQLHQTIVDSLAHADYPFSLLVESLSPKRDASRNPIFSVLIDWLTASDPLVMAFLEPNAQAPIQLGGLQITPLPLRQLGGVLDQIWMVGDLGDKVALKLGFSTDLFTSDTASSMVQSFVQLLQDALADPDKSLVALELLTSAERRRILAASDGWVDSAPGSVTEQLAAQVARTPEAVALAANNLSLTYKELAAHTSQLADFLGSCGVCAQTLVGLYVDDPRHLAVGTLGILKAGGACVPLDPLVTPSELGSRLAALCAPVLLTTSLLRERLGSAGGTIVELDTLAAEIARRSPASRASVPQPDEVAFVLHDTQEGTPQRGALLAHGALQQAVHAAVGSWKIEAGARVLRHGRGELAALPIDILITLCSGGTLVLEAPLDRVGSALAQVLQTSRIDTLIATAAVVSSLPAPAQQPAPAQLDDLQSLRRVIVRGEPASPARFARLRRDIQVLGVYGNAETAYCAAVAPYVPGEAAALIGRPVGPAKLLVLDRRQQLVPRGVIGEVHIGGQQVSGTGWLGRLRADGLVEYHGRQSDALQVRKCRVNRGLTESVLLLHPAVKDCFLMQRAGRDEPPRLIAYVKLAPGQRLAAAELPLYLRARLPNTEVPEVLFVEQLPLNRQGEVDRQLLPAQSQGTQFSSYLAPRDRLELALCQIWERVLKKQPIGIRDDFFSLGGHSLLAVQVRVQVQQQLQQDFLLPVLNQTGTVERLAEFLRSRPQAGVQSPLVVLRDGKRPPLFFAHPIGGHVLCYAELARRFRADQAIIGLQSPALEDGGTLHPSLEELAAYYVTAMQQRQPEGPYRIAGWSFGGILAFEIAQQLSRRGARVELLAILDSVPPAMLGALNAMDDVAALSFLRERSPQPQDPAAPAEPTVLRRILEDMAERGLLPDPSDQRQINQMLRIYRHHGQLLRSYTLSPCSSPLLVLLASERWYMPSIDQSAAAWQALSTSPIRAVTLPGGHFSILLAEQSLQLIAETLQGALDAIG